MSVFVMLSRLYIDAFGSPEGKGLTSLALVCDVICDFVTFLFGILGQVWYLIASIPDPCCLSYFAFAHVLRFHLCTIFTPQSGSISNQWP